MFCYLEVFRNDVDITTEEVEILCKNISKKAFVESTGIQKMVLVRFPDSIPSIVDIATAFPNATEIRPVPEVPLIIVTL